MIIIFAEFGAQSQNFTDGKGFRLLAQTHVDEARTCNFKRFDKFGGFRQRLNFFD